MLDSDLAKLYKVETMVLNQAVKRNISRFPERYRFQLTKEENEILKSQIVISKTEDAMDGRGDRRNIMESQDSVVLQKPKSRLPIIALIFGVYPLCIIPIFGWLLRVIGLQ